MLKEKSPRFFNFNQWLFNEQSKWFIAPLKRQLGELARLVENGENAATELLAQGWFWYHFCYSHISIRQAAGIHPKQTTTDDQPWRRRRSNIQRVRQTILPVNDSRNDRPVRALTWHNHDFAKPNPHEQSKIVADAGTSGMQRNEGHL